MADQVASPQAPHGFSDPFFHDSGFVPVDNVISGGSWGPASCVRIIAYLGLRVHTFFAYVLTWKIIQQFMSFGIYAVRCFFRNFCPGEAPSLRYTNSRVTFAFIKRWEYIPLRYGRYVTNFWLMKRTLRWTILQHSATSFCGKLLSESTDPRWAR